MTCAPTAAPKPMIQYVRLHRPAASNGGSANQARCAHCQAERYCALSQARETNEHPVLQSGVRRVRSGQTIIRQGDRFAYLYAVHGGTVKATIVGEHEQERVEDFFFAGDIFGLDGLAEGVCRSTAVALEDTELCFFDFEAIRRAALQDRSFHDQLCRALGHEIARYQGHLMILGHLSTEARLASFLMRLSESLKNRGFAANEFHMRMSRAEIGSYLGMTLETVSRTFSAFHQAGVLDVSRRHVCIRDAVALRDLATRESRRGRDRSDGHRVGATPLEG